MKSRDEPSESVNEAGYARHSIDEHLEHGPGLTATFRAACGSGVSLHRKEVGICSTVPGGFAAWSGRLEMFVMLVRTSEC